MQIVFSAYLSYLVLLFKFSLPPSLSLLLSLTICILVYLKMFHGSKRVFIFLHSVSLYLSSCLLFFFVSNVISLSSEFSFYLFIFQLQNFHLVHFYNLSLLIVFILCDTVIITAFSSFCVIFLNSSCIIFCTQK